VVYTIITNAELPDTLSTPDEPVASDNGLSVTGVTAAAEPEFSSTLLITNLLIEEGITASPSVSHNS
jgi:hypothetical protein